MYEITILDEITEIKEECDKKISENGENFNVFEVLGIKDKENIHSNMITTLLNPKTKYNKGDLFLKLFLKYLEVETFDIKDIKIQREKVLKNGRIDIFIENSKKQKIFIENKIYAGDQDKQLVRYSEQKPYKMFYLTLDGHDASNESKGNLKEGSDYYLLSYEKDILNWLEECEKYLENEKSSRYSLLKGTIKQYRILVGNLTGKSRSKEMENEIINKLLEHKENLKTAFEITQAIPTVKEQIIKEKLIPTVNKQKNLEFKIYENKKISQCYYGFSCRIEEKKLSIAFEFQSGNCSNLVYGIRRPDKEKEKEEYEKLTNYLKKKNYKTDFPRSNWTLCKRMGNDYSNWDNQKFLDILDCDNNGVTKYIVDRIEKILNIIKDYQ